MNHIIILTFAFILLITPSASALSPDHPAYRVTTMVNDLQELLTFNQTSQIILKQQHMISYLKDLNLSKNNAYILEKISSKHKEVDDMLQKVSSMDEIKHNQEVLYNLLNSTTMPFQSKKGLHNAFNNSIITIHAYKNIKSVNT